MTPLARNTPPTQQDDTQPKPQGAQALAGPTLGITEVRVHVVERVMSSRCQPRGLRRNTHGPVQHPDVCWAHANIAAHCSRWLSKCTGVTP